MYADTFLFVIYMVLCLLNFEHLICILCFGLFNTDIVQDSEIDFFSNSLYKITYQMECVICYQVPTSDFYKTTRCSHTEHVCEDCLYTKQATTRFHKCPICRTSYNTRSMKRLDRIVFKMSGVLFNWDYKYEKSDLVSDFGFWEETFIRWENKLDKWRGVDGVDIDRELELLREIRDEYESHYF